jgi:hypothetical protein
MIIATVCLAAGLVLAGGSAPKYRSIHDVDFQNFTYEVWSGYTVQARGGRSTRSKGADPSDPQIDGVTVTFGDLTGDEKDEAAVVVYTDGGGTGSFSEGFVYALRDGVIQVLTEFEGGDRTADGIWTVSISDGLLKVERESGSCMACVEEIVTAWYRWDGKALLPVRTARRKWDGQYPPEPR